MWENDFISRRQFRHYLSVEYSFIIFFKILHSIGSLASSIKDHRILGTVDLLSILLPLHDIFVYLAYFWDHEK